MRVVAGRLGGRPFNSPHGHRTHPMSDKVRGALFNTLGDIEGLTVLDAFAGSGALSFEAISRGAKSATVIDSDRHAQITISENLNSLGLKDSVKLIKASAASWLNTTQETFDLVLLDPPYDNPQLTLVERLAKRTKPQGIAVVSLKPNTVLQLSQDFKELHRKTYGDAELAFYRRTS